MYKIRPTDPARRQTWIDLIGMDALPVADPRPRLVGGVLSYDVLLHDLTEMQRARLAAFVARNQREPYIDVLAQVGGGVVAVPAVGCELLEAATAVSRSGEDV